eukprot:166688-Amphidinium_carterae.1
MQKVGVKFARHVEALWSTASPSLVASSLQQHIVPEAFSDIVCRQDSNTATVMVVTSELQKLLRVSGLGQVYYKLKDSTQEVVWLEEHTGHLAAMELAAATEHSLGLVSKGEGYKIRYGVRFAAEHSAHMRAFAAAQGVEEQVSLGRFSASGVPPQLGAVGLWQVLESQGWHLHEVLHVENYKAVFLASQRGQASLVLALQPDGIKQPIRTKALNAAAKAMAGPASSTSTPTQARVARNQRTLVAGQRALPTQPVGGPVQQPQRQQQQQSQQQQQAQQPPPPPAARQPPREQPVAGDPATPRGQVREHDGASSGQTPEQHRPRRDHATTGNEE